MTIGSALDGWVAILAGGMGALIYFSFMIGFAWSRHKRERRMEQRQERIERMTRDLWIFNLRGGK